MSNDVYPKRKMSISEMEKIGGYSRRALNELCHSKAGRIFARNPTGGKWIIDTSKFEEWERTQDAKRRR